MTARERLAVFLDAGSFREVDAMASSPLLQSPLPTPRPMTGDGVITGTGTVYGKTVAVYAQDFTVHGGSLSRTHANKICKVTVICLPRCVPALDYGLGCEDRVSDCRNERFRRGEDPRRNRCTGRICRHFPAECRPEWRSSTAELDYGSLCRYTLALLISSSVGATRRCCV